MFIPIEKQLELISDFLNREEFKGKALIIDNRFFPIISWYSMDISLSNLNVIISDNIWFLKWRFYH